MMLFLNDLPVDISRAFWMDDVDDRFEVAMYWTGRYPVARNFYDRIETEYKRAEKAS
jgi:hypothetical protein